METALAKVREFHEKFGVPVNTTPRPLTPTDANFRIKFMFEELDEYTRATDAGDLVKQFDALIDLLYVVLGTVLWHGFPIVEGFDLVHAANMAKIRAGSAQQSRDETGRNHPCDVIKPPGWEAPDAKLRELLSGQLRAL